MKEFNVLLVEDKLGDVRLVQAMLAQARDAHFNVEHVSRLETALERLTQDQADIHNPIDVILLDLSLPDSIGYHTFSQVCTQAPDVPVVLLTATDDESLAIQAAGEGAQDYLVKGEVESRWLVRALRYAIERKRAQQQLSLQSKALEAAANAIVITDVEGHIVWANQAFTRLTGYRLEEVKGQGLGLLKSGQHPPIFYERMWKTILAGAVWHGEIINRRKDDSLYTEEMTITPVHDERGQIVNFIAIKQDITQRKQLEAARNQAREALQRRYQELSLLNRVIIKASSTLDVEEVLEVICEELTSVFGLPRAMALLINGDTAVVTTEYFETGKSRDGLQAVDRPSVSGMQISIPDNAAMVRMLSQKTPISLMNGASVDKQMTELRTLMHERETVALLLVPVVVRGRVISAIALESPKPRDFNENETALAMAAAAAVGQALEAAELYQTLQRYTNEIESLVTDRTAELQQAVERAQDADRAKSQFLSNVSHELRTPLANIRLYLNLLNRGREEKKLDYLETLTRETSRLQKLIEDLMDVSRLDLGKIQASLQPTDLNQLAHTLAMDRKKLFEDKGLAFSIVVGTELPILMVDPRLLEQVLTNLLTNALNYTPTGGAVTLQMDVIDTQQAQWATIRVQDTGPGISKEEQANLFKRFYRGKASQANDVPGAGLGLTICKEIMDLHQGHITVDSEVGEGTTFTVWLPVDLGNHNDICNRI
jgi:PAS domain S-box-containing protein